MKKTINIFMTEDEKKQAHKIQQKYKVSLTTITDVLIFVSYYAFLHYSKGLKTNEKLMQEYISKGNKTSIKTPKILKEQNSLMENLIKGKEAIYCTNILKLYLNHNIKEYLTEDGQNYYWNKIDKELQEKQEKYWNYNNFSRMSRRNLRENKEYYKRAIKQMEQK